jgi:hypothetical protein
MAKDVTRQRIRFVSNTLRKYISGEVTWGTSLSPGELDDGAGQAGQERAGRIGEHSRVNGGEKSGDVAA